MLQVLGLWNAHQEPDRNWEQAQFNGVMNIPI